VYVNRRGPVRGNDVVMDEPAAVRLFLDHVAALGHRRIALIDGPVEVDTVHRRALAARRACAARGLQLTVLHAAATEVGGWEAIQRLLRRGAGTGRARPTACAVGSLNQMFGVMAALRNAGLAVPESMSLVSLDEDECLAFLDVPVTSVAMPLAGQRRRRRPDRPHRRPGHGRRDDPRAHEPDPPGLGGPSPRELTDAHPPRRPC
jgi:DNA-binding LacI/PurR family transcriptional regulator